MDADEITYRGEVVIDDILEHFGMKGMKWGVRKVQSGLQAQGERRAERKFVSQVTNPRKNVNLHIKLHNATIDAMNNHISRINSKPEYVKAANAGRLLNDFDPVTKKYTAEYMKSYEKELNREATKLGTSPSGKQYQVQLGNDFLGFQIGLKDAKHADDPESFRVEFIKDDQGLIIGFKLVDDSLTQGEVAVGDILTHFGVKGMRWGVRRKATVGPREVIVRDTRKGIKTKGGEGHPAVESAIRARKIGQIAKKSGLKAISDDDLNAYARRIQLEQNVARLQFSEKSRGARFLDSFLGRQGSRLANEATKQGATYAGRKALNKATRRSAKLAFAVAAA